MRVVWVLLLAVLAAGCASLRHQVPPEEPHAMLRIKRTDSDTDAVQRVVTIDGRKVRGVPWSERSYRITPGMHSVTAKVEKKETRANPYAGIQTVVWLLGSFALEYAGHTAYGSAPSDHYTVTSYSHVTNTFIVEAGRVYILEGPAVVNEIGSNQLLHRTQ